MHIIYYLLVRTQFVLITFNKATIIELINNVAFEMKIYPIQHQS